MLMRSFLILILLRVVFILLILSLIEFNVELIE